MPYIEHISREKWDKVLKNLLYLVDEQANVGSINYILTRIITACPLDSYYSINSMIGVLECAKLELYRRIAVPYEENKKEENGDVYAVEAPLVMKKRSRTHIPIADLPEVISPDELPLFYKNACEDV